MQLPSASKIFFRLASSAALTALVATSVYAGPADLQRSYAVSATRDNGKFAGFSSARGQKFFESTHGAQWSCSSCHTDNPLLDGKHAKTGRRIQPLAPAATPERFTDEAKVEKWFRRNCNDVVGRECTAQEKGDVIAYLLSLKK